MNQYLKYFIYFLLGVIIYYFLFNSPNAKAQKLIEGFDNDVIDRSKILYLKSKYKITSEGTDGVTISSDDNVNELLYIQVSEIGPKDLNTGGWNANIPTNVSENMILNNSALDTTNILSNFTQNTNESVFLDPRNFTDDSDAPGNWNEPTDDEILNKTMVSVNFDIDLPEIGNEITINFKSIHEEEEGTFKEGTFDTGTFKYDETITAITDGQIQMSNDNTFFYKHAQGHIFGIHIPQITDDDIRKDSLLKENIKIVVKINDPPTDDSNFNEFIQRANDENSKTFTISLPDIGELQNKKFLGESGVSGKVLQFPIKINQKDAFLEMTLNMNITSILDTLQNFTYTPGIMTDVQQDSARRSHARATLTPSINFIEYVQIYKELTSQEYIYGDISEEEQGVRDKADQEYSSIILAEIVGTDSEGSFGGGHIGCNPSVCTKANDRLNDLGYFNVNYTIKTGDTTNDFKSCSPSVVGTAEYTNAHNHCTKDICCHDQSCNFKFFAHGFKCGDKAIIPSGTCDEQHQGVACEDTCCGESISGVIRKIFYSIVRFRNTLSDKDDIGNSKIYLIDIIYYLYHNLLDLEGMVATVPEVQAINSGNVMTSYGHYKALRTWLETALEGTPQGGVYNWDDTVVSQIQLKGEIFNNGMNIPQFLKKFGVNIPATLASSDDTIVQYGDLEGGQDNLSAIGTGLEQYLKKYNEYTPSAEKDDPLAHYSHDDLKEDLKKAIVIMTRPSPNIIDGGEEPIALFKFGTNAVWEKIQITLSEFQMYL